MKVPSEALMLAIELAVMVGLLVFARGLVDASKVDVAYAADYIPDGSCLTIYSDRPILFNSTLQPQVLTICKAGGRVIKP